MYPVGYLENLHIKVFGMFLWVVLGVLGVFWFVFFCLYTSVFSRLLPLCFESLHTAALSSALIILIILNGMRD